MPLSTLLNTSWLFNTHLQSEFNTSQIFSVTFTSNDNTYASFQVNVGEAPLFNTWVNPAYRRVTFTGGSDIANQDLIDFVEHNAIQGTDFYTVTVSKTPTSGGNVSGGGDYADGTNFTIRASAAQKYSFRHWLNSRTGQIVSTNSTYTSTNYGAQSLSFTAVFEYNGYKPSVDPEDLPTATITDTKATDWMKHGDTDMYCIFLPTKAQLSNLATWLYGSDFLSSIAGQGILGIDLMDVMIGLQVLPFAITSTNSKTVKVGWWNVATGSGPLTMNYTLNNYFELDCGSVTVSGIYNGALDYQTNIEIYLPFIGYQSLETYDVINHTLNAKYQIDLLTGDCICKISVDGSVKYQFTGQCGYSIPLSQVHKTALVEKSISAAVQIVSSIATPVAVSTGGSTTSKTSFRRNKEGAITSTKNVNEREPTTRNVENSPYRIAAEAIGTIANMGNGSSKGGSLQGNTGYLGIGKPYLSIVRPHVDIPPSFGAHNGFPCNKTLQLGTLSGFTMVEEVHLTGFNCTSDELDEVYSLLKEGVIF